MKFSTILAFLAFGGSSALAAKKSLAYDPIYDAAGTSLTQVACSDGENGLITKGYTTFGSLPAPIGAADAITGYNSPSCGTCWSVTYTNSAANFTKTVHFIAGDVSGGGFVIGKNLMNTLTNNQAEHLGVVNVDYAKVANSVCRL